MSSPSLRHRNSSCVGPFKIFRIITLVTQKGKGKVCPSQRLWWEESMTSSMFLPQGTEGRRLTGINSRPLISRPVRCLVSLLWEPLVIVSKSSYRIYIPLPFLFLFGSPCFTVHHNLLTVQWGTLECPISRHLTLCLWQFSLQLSVGAAMLPHCPRAVLLLEPSVVKYWEQRWYASLIDTAVILNGRLYVCLGARRAIHPDTLVTKGAVNAGARLFD